MAPVLKKLGLKSVSKWSFFSNDRAKQKIEALNLLIEHEKRDYNDSFYENKIRDDIKVCDEWLYNKFLGYDSNNILNENVDNESTITKFGINTDLYGRNKKYYLSNHNKDIFANTSLSWKDADGPDKFCYSINSQNPYSYCYFVNKPNMKIFMQKFKKLIDNDQEFINICKKYEVEINIDKNHMKMIGIAFIRITASNIDNIKNLLSSDEFMQLISK